LAAAAALIRARALLLLLLSLLFYFLSKEIYFPKVGGGIQANYCKLDAVFVPRAAVTYTMCAKPVPGK